MAKVTKKAVKKRVKKNVEHGQAHIQASFNNTIVTPVMHCPGQAQADWASEVQGNLLPMQHRWQQRLLPRLLPYMDLRQSMYS